MPNLAVGDVLSVNWNMRMAEQQILLTTHWKITDITGGGFNVEMNALFEAMNTLFDSVGEVTDCLVDCLCTDVSILSVDFQSIYNPRYIKVPLLPAQDAGTVAGNSLPPNVAHVMTLRTDVAGRDQIGNKHIGPVPPSFTSGGRVTATGNGAYAPLLTALKTPISVSAGGVDVNLDPCIYRRSDPGNSPLITNGYLQQTTRVERRRTVGLGS